MSKARGIGCEGQVFQPAAGDLRYFSRVNFAASDTIAATMTVFSLFDTAIGQCAIAWGACGIACVQLPEANESTTRARVLQRFPRAREAAPPSDAERARDGIVAYLLGEPGDLSSILLDMARVPPFHRRVYEAARGIPWGATMTYGALAALAGGSARAVGQALARNPFAIIVPCHRVVAAGGRIGGFSASGGPATKLRLLAIEGYAQSAQGIFDGRFLAVRPHRYG